MRILGVDPGSRNLGYACIEKSGKEIRVHTHGTLKLTELIEAAQTSDQSVPARLKGIFDGLKRVIEEFKPNVLAVEKVFFAKNVVSALKLGQARGVVLFCGAQFNLQVFEYSATEVKNAITGFGRADKDHVAKMLKTILGHQSFESADASDALALALCHAILQGSSAPTVTRKNKSIAESVSHAVKSREGIKI